MPGALPASEDAAARSKAKRAGSRFDPPRSGCRSLILRERSGERSSHIWFARAAS